MPFPPPEGARKLGAARRFLESAGGVIAGVPAAAARTPVASFPRMFAIDAGGA
ncbi:Uncharacterized protein pbN1_12350 [Aromatoleum bremense]|nr:Uncharacterized protein pbN1_12350 [Aromatoleum bremense]